MTGKAESNRLRVGNFFPTLFLIKGKSIYGQYLHIGYEYDALSRRNLIALIPKSWTIPNNPTALVAPTPERQLVPTYRTLVSLDSIIFYPIQSIYEKWPKIEISLYLRVWMANILSYTSKCEKTQANRTGSFCSTYQSTSTYSYLLHFYNIRVLCNIFYTNVGTIITNQVPYNAFSY